MKPEPPYGVDEMHPKPVPMWFRHTVNTALAFAALGAVWAVIALISLVWK